MNIIIRFDNFSQNKILTNFRIFEIQDFTFKMFRFSFYIIFQYL